MKKIAFFLFSVLLIVSVICAGCTNSTEPLVGQWKTNRGIADVTYIFYGDGTGYLTVDLLSDSSTCGLTWVYDNEKYHITVDNRGMAIGYVSADGQTLTIDAKEVFTLERKSYNVPAVRPRITANQSYETPTPTPSYNIPTPTPTPSSTAVGSVGTLMQYNNGDCHFDWVVNEVIRGAQAYNILQKEYTYDITPKTGNQYYMIRLTITNKGNEKLEINSGYTFELYADGAKINQEFKKLPAGYKDFSSTYILPGATISGWLVFIVPDRTDVKLYFNAKTYGKFGDLGSYYVHILPRR